MSQLFKDICQGLQEAIRIERGEIRLIPHPARDKLPAPTFIADPEPDHTDEHVTAHSKNQE